MPDTPALLDIAKSQVSIGLHDIAMALMNNPG
jgi:hypothetical protein